VCNCILFPHALLQNWDLMDLSQILGTIQTRKLRIFMLIIFRFITVFSLEKIETLEDAIELALAADEYLLQPLREICAKLIEEMMNMENIWNTLQQLNMIPDLAKAACGEVL
jgi:hypothetical protein